MWNALIQNSYGNGEMNAEGKRRLSTAPIPAEGFVALMGRR